MCIRCDSEGKEPICPPCLSAIASERPLWSYPYTILGSGIVGTVVQEASLSLDGESRTTAGTGDLGSALKRMEGSYRDKKQAAAGYLNRLLHEMGIPLRLDVFEPVVLLEEDRELLDAIYEKAEKGGLWDSPELCLRIGNILWHYGNSLKDRPFEADRQKANLLFRRALKYFLRADNLGSDLNSLRSVALALGSLNEHGKCLEYLGKLAHQLDGQLLLARGAALRRSGNDDEAVECLERALKLDRSPPMLLEAGRVLESMGRLKDALDRYEEVFIFEERNAEALRARDSVMSKLEEQRRSESMRLEEQRKAEEARLEEERRAETAIIEEQRRAEAARLERMKAEEAKKERFVPEPPPPPAPPPPAPPAAFEEKPAATGPAPPPPRNDDIQERESEFKRFVDRERESIMRQKLELEQRVRALVEKEARIREAEVRLSGEGRRPAARETGTPAVVKLPGLAVTEESSAKKGEGAWVHFKQVKGAEEPKVWQEIAAKALACIKEKKYKDALYFFDAALRLNPKNAEIWLNKAAVFERLEMLREALQAYDLVIQMNLGDDRVWERKISVLRKLGRLDDAVEAYQDMIPAAADPERAMIEKGRLLASMGRSVEAATCFNAVIKKNHKNIQALLSMGDTFMSMGRDNEAYQYFNIAAEIDPRNSETWYRRGLLQNRWGRWGAAIQFFNWAISLNARFVEAWMSKGEVLREHGEPEDALYCLEKATSLDPENEEAWLRKAKLLWEMKRHPDAMACIERLLDMSPKDEGAIDARIRMLEKLADGRRERAANVEYLMRKATALHEFGRQDDALKVLALTLKLDPRNEDALLKTAELLVEDGKFKRALAKYTMLLSINPKNSPALLGKARLYMRLASHDEASTCLTLLLRMEPGNEEAKRLRDECLGRLKGD